MIWGLRVLVKSRVALKCSSPLHSSPWYCKSKREAEQAGGARQASRRADVGQARVRTCGRQKVG